MYVRLWYSKDILIQYYKVCHLAFFYGPQLILKAKRYCTVSRITSYHFLNGKLCALRLPYASRILLGIQRVFKIYSCSRYFHTEVRASSMLLIHSYNITAVCYDSSRFYEFSHVVHSVPAFFTQIFYGRFTEISTCPVS